MKVCSPSSQQGGQAMDKSKEKKREQVPQQSQAFQDDVQIAKQVESTPLKLLKGDGIVLDPHLSWEDAHKQITGTKDFEVAHNIVNSGAAAILGLVENGEPMFEQAVTCLNVILQNLHDFQPKDAIEASLVTKAAALFQHGMDRLSKLASSENVRNSEAQANMAIKLLRCHNETIEALSRYRRGGEQRVVVQHIAEKIAVVNNFGDMGGGGSQENRGASPCP